ncbi:MAG TPA: hypothetical protein VGI81_25365, partial [Tepidisphaeraceae bacterium]
MRAAAHRWSRSSCLMLGLLVLLTAVASRAAAEVELQPMAAQARRIVEAMEQVGSPLPAEDRRE